MYQVQMVMYQMVCVLEYQGSLESHRKMLIVTQLQPNVGDYMEEGLPHNCSLYVML
jgi:hypothetical protein